MYIVAGAPKTYDHKSHDLSVTCTIYQGRESYDIKMLISVLNVPLFFLQKTSNLHETGSLTLSKN